MGLIGKIFGTEKTVEAINDRIDKSFLSDQEKREIKIKMLEAYAPYKLTLRFLALIVGITFSASFLITFVASFWLDVSVQKEILENSYMGISFITMMGFFFADEDGFFHGRINSIKDKNK